MTAWMGLESVMINEISQVIKDKYLMKLSHILGFLLVFIPFSLCTSTLEVTIDVSSIPPILYLIPLDYL